MTFSPGKIGENIFPSQVSYVDPEFLQIFTLPSVIGDTKSLHGTGDVLLSDEMTHILFGNENPLGRSILIFNDQSEEFTFTVSAVFKKFPENSSFKKDVLLLYDNFLRMWNVHDDNWKLHTTALFVQIPDKSLVPSIISSLKEYLPIQNKAREDFRINRFSLIPLKDVGSNTQNIRSPGLFSSMNNLPNHHRRRATLYL
jgi:hypothetical protein